VGFLANRLVVFGHSEKRVHYWQEEHVTRITTIEHIRKHRRHSTTHINTLFAGGASLDFGFVRGKLAANFLFREAFAPIFARGSSMGAL
jgi:hypothetical protein